MLEADWYDYPQYYDLLFRSETRLEADFLEAAAASTARFRCGRCSSRPADPGGGGRAGRIADTASAAST